MGLEGAEGIKNNLTREGPLGALEVETAKGFLQESVAAMIRLSRITLIKILISRKAISLPRLSHMPTPCLAKDTVICTDLNEVPHGYSDRVEFKTFPTSYLHAQYCPRY